MRTKEELINDICGFNPTDQPSRFEEISRAIDEYLEERFNSTFILKVQTEQTGGNIMVDYATMINRPYVIGITDDTVDVFRKREDEYYGDVEELIGSIELPYGDADTDESLEVNEPNQQYFTKLKQMEYIDEVTRAMERLLHVWGDLNAVWNKDSRHEIDLNNYLQPMYPFGKSFDELQNDVDLWVKDSASKLIRLKRELHPDHLEIMGEDAVKYNSVVATVTLPVEYRTEDCSFFDADYMHIKIPSKVRQDLLYAMTKCEKNEWQAIEIWCGQYITLKNEKGEEETEWRSGCDYFKVRAKDIRLVMVHKHNEQAIIESCAFTIDENLTISAI